jgi:hypothetical protein
MKPGLPEPNNYKGKFCHEQLKKGQILKKEKGQIFKKITKQLRNFFRIS